MIISGRPGMWDDWLQFQADQARARREEIARLEREAYLKRQKIKKYFDYFLIAFISTAVVAGITWLIIFVSTYHN